MILNIFFNINNSLVDMKEINKTHNQPKDMDWYYLSGAIELIGSNGTIILAKESLVDIIPFFRELFVTILSYNRLHKLQKDVELIGKICSKTTLYYDRNPEFIFEHINDMFIGVSVIHKHSQDCKIYSINENMAVFYEIFVNKSKEFSEKVKLLFPGKKIEACELIDKWADDIKIGAVLE